MQNEMKHSDGAFGGRISYTTGIDASIMSLNETPYIRDNEKTPMLLFYIAA